MSKVNVDEIKVGDLVGFDSYAYKGQVSVGYVTRIEAKKDSKQFWGHFGSSPMPGREEFLNDYSVDYHWKVVNFEEESKMDELKVYTGKETIEALLEGKVLSWSTDQYKLEEGTLYEKNGPNEWRKSYRSLAHFTNNKFTKVDTPQVGDWVRVKRLGDLARVAQINDTDGDAVWADWGGGKKYYRIPEIDWEILSPEQVSEYKREQAFAKVGRKLNEYKHGDIVYIDALAVVATVITKNNGTEEIKLHGINEAGKGYTARAHQLTPISFVENQVSLD